jgi:hypothetical protein
MAKWGVACTPQLLTIKGEHMSGELTYWNCHKCKDTWNPYYGMLSIKDDVKPAIIIYTCINCMPDDEEEE